MGKVKDWEKREGLRQGKWGLGLEVGKVKEVVSG